MKSTAWMVVICIGITSGFLMPASVHSKCAACMAVDRAVDAGLVVCVAAGNGYWVGAMPSPAAADRAITVGALNDQGTVVRNDETHAGFSNSGPRTSDNDNDTEGTKIATDIPDERECAEGGERHE